MKRRRVHLPELGRGISLGSSQIPRICVLRQKHTRLTVTPARRPVPGPPARLPLRPTHDQGPLSGILVASVLGPLAPSRAGGRRHGVCKQLSERPRLQQPEPKERHPPCWAQPRAARVGEGPPAAPTPTARPLAERLPSEWSSLNIHFMVAAGKGRSRLSEPRSSEHQPQQQRERRQRC